MKYSAVPLYDGFIIEWLYDGEERSIGQYPRIWVEQGKRILVEECAGSAFIEASLVSSVGVHSKLRFIPDTPPILHRGKGGPPEFCEKSQRVDGKFHSWEFDGDDPWVVCCWCGARRRA